LTRGLGKTLDFCREKIINIYKLFNRLQGSPAMDSSGPHQAQVLWSNPRDGAADSRIAHHTHSWIGLTALALAVLAGLTLARWYDYLLFHTLAELASIVVGMVLLVLVWNTQDAPGNGLLQVVGTGYAAAAGLDLAHALAYKGMNIFHGFDANLPTQLWIAARTVQALALLAAPAAHRRSLRPPLLMAGFTALALALAAAVFSGHFPDCYREGAGLTPFKVAGEYVIIVILAAALVRMRRLRPPLPAGVGSLVQASIAVTILGEAAFTQYVGVYDLANMVGHLLKVAAYYLIYRALFVVSVRDPFHTLLGQLGSSRQAILESRDAARQEAAERTLELAASEARHQIMLDTALDAVYLIAADGRLLDVNQAACQMLGYTREEFLAMRVEDVDARKPAQDTAERIANVLREGRLRFQAWHQGKDGRILPVEVSCRLGQDGGSMVAYVRDISEREARDAALARMVRLYDALSQVNQAIVMASASGPLMDQVCRILVDRGGCRMAWIGREVPVTHEVALLSRAGDATGFLDLIHPTSDEATPWGRTPAGQALRKRSCSIALDFTPPLPPWCMDAVQRAGFRAVAAFPILQQEGPPGVLCVYAETNDFLGLEEVQLLEEVAADLAYALDHLSLEARRRLGEESLRASEEKFFKVFHSSPLLITLTQLTDGRLIDVNGSFCLAGGFERPEVLGRTVRGLRLLDPEAQERMAESIERQGHVRNLELNLRARDGRLIPCLLSAECIDVGGERLLVSMYADITEIKHATEERRLLQAEVDHMQKMESLGRLAGGIAHDMNNVLGAIFAAVQTIQVKYRDFADLVGLLETVEKAAIRGRDLVKGLAGFSRKELGVKQPVDPNELVRQEMALLERTLMKKYELRLDLEEPLDPVLGESGLLGSALMNLCVNAVDAMPDGGTLTLRTRRIEGDFILIEVEDTGEGMTPEVLQKATEPFFTTKPQGKGTGLGLATAFNTVRSHGGTLSLLSQPGLGTRARMKLPATRAGQPDQPTLAAQDVAFPAHSILLVDDDDLVRGAVAGMIGLLGPRVETAASGAAALEALDRGPLPDLMILDLNMPGMNGLEVLRRLRAKHQALPVLLATGRLDEAAGAVLATDPHARAIGKPFSLEEARAKLVELAEGARGARPTPIEPSGVGPE
jgi:PAS domain S-box-containing protein